MRWSHKGTQLDDRAGMLVKQFKERNAVVVFGAGKIGTELGRILRAYNIFAGFMDNDIRKQEKEIDNSVVFSLDDYRNNKMKQWIVIAASDDNCKDMRSQLEDAGFVYKLDFWMHDEFIKEVFPILSFYYFQKLYVDLAQICVTERCTLRCKKCAHACQNVDKKSPDMDLALVKKSADNFFKYVDVVGEFVLIGGEPFLYQQLGEAIEYIGKNYRDQILRFAITTNGTILPNDYIVDLCKKYDVTIRVSNYSRTLPNLKRRYELFYKKTDDLDVITWETNDKECWLDYGYGEYDRGNNSRDLQCAFDICKTNCREVRGNRYYYCVMARSVSDNMKWNIGCDDYLDLEKLENRKLLFEFQQGYSDKGYLDMCRYCRGAEAKNYLIPAAEQGV